MSKPTTYDKIQQKMDGNTFAWPNAFDRLRSIPLEKYSVFPDYGTAADYAAGRGDYEGLAYDGQVVAVSSETGQRLYIVDGTATDYLREVGGESGGGIPAEHTHNINDINDLQKQLSGLSSEDENLFGQIANVQSQLSGKAEKTHSHGINTIQNLQSTLNSKANVGHIHEISAINNLQLTLDYITSIATGGGGGGGDGTMIGYTVNGKAPDVNGNFQIEVSSIGAANAEHLHEISSIDGLSSALDSKAAADHTHEMVTGITIGENTLTGDIQLSGIGNVEIEQTPDTVSIKVTPFTADRTEAVIDPGTGNAYRLFVGTEREWSAFKETLPDNSKYLVFLRS